MRIAYSVFRAPPTITHHTSRIMHHASLITHRLLRIAHHAPRITYHESRITHHALRITHDVVRFVHVGRQHNRLADALANEAADGAWIVGDDRYA